MCRLLAVVADRVAAIPELVPDELARFETLSAVHTHGWGIAHVAATGEVRVDREPTRASRSAAWWTALDTIRTDAATLHIRQASPGMPLVSGNTHPFLVDGAAFAHNGYAWPNERLEALLVDAGGPAVAPGFEGDTDSERYFALARALDLAHDPASALLHAAAEVSTRATATSLNVLLLTPHELVAVAWWHAAVIRAGPDGESERDYRLWYRVAPDRVVVGSAGVANEGSDDWQELPHGHALVVSRRDLATRVVSARDLGLDLRVGVGPSPEAGPGVVSAPLAAPGVISSPE